MKKITVICLTLIFFTGTALVSAAKNEPMEELRGPIEKGISILKNPEYKDDSEAQREKIWEIIQNVFDFRAVSIRALARNWRLLSPEQREVFTTEFTELLKNNYLDKIQGEFQDEEVVFEEQDMLSEDKAVVRTTVIRKNVETPIDYRVHLKDGKWRIYDVNIEGISLVQNYRKQFNDILAKEKPDALIQRLKEKNKAHAEERQKKG
ncbi:MAG: MlaC/ttg2D family ABC transporter substrate-binding protein [Thermodesulfobacteriota bacterium]